MEIPKPVLDAYMAGYCFRCFRKRTECEALRIKYGQRCVEIHEEFRRAQSE